MHEGSVTLQLSQTDRWAIKDMFDRWETDAAGEEIFLSSAFALKDKVFGNAGAQIQYNAGSPRIYCGDGSNAFIKHDGTKLTWKGANTELDASGNLTCTGGTIAGWTISATTLANGTDIILDSSNKKISVNDATFGNAGIQLDYNGGTPRGYIGDGSSQYFKFDGTNTSWKGTNTELTAAGELTCTNINATGGIVGGFTLAATTMTATNFLLDAGNQKTTLGSGNDIISLDAADATYRLAIGHATYASAPFRVTKAGAITSTSGTIGGWTIAATTLASANITLDDGNDKITVNTITIDGANDRIRSGNYVAGPAGTGFTVEPDLIEAGNLAARGILRTAVFQKDVISAVGGNVLISQGSDVLATDMTAADASTLTIEGNETFAVGDFLRVKDSTDDEWLYVLSIVSAPTYSVQRDKASVYGADANPAWKKGATVVNYGSSGSGAIHLTASETNAPFMAVYTHAGAPWSALTTRLRIGNLNGYLGYSSDIYGIGIGDTNSYIKCDPTNGVQMQVTAADAITIKAGGDIKLEADASDPGRIYFEGTTYACAFGNLSATGDQFYFWPKEAGDDGDVYLRMGATTQRWKQVWIYSSERNYIERYGDSNNYETIDMYSPTILISLCKGGTERRLRIYHDAPSDPYFAPTTDNDWRLGTNSNRWQEIFAYNISLANTGLHLFDTNASHDLIIAPGSDLTADRTLTLTTGDADRTLTISGNATLDQDVDTSASPTFAGITLNSHIVTVSGACTLNDWFDQSMKTTASPQFANLFINETANANMTTGITINQGSATDEIFALKYSRYAHGVTTVTETDTFFLMTPPTSVTKGVDLIGLGYEVADVAMTIKGYAESPATGTNATAKGIVTVDGMKVSGTGGVDAAASENVFCVASDGDSLFFVKGDGDIYYDGADQGAFDSYEDALACADLSANLSGQFGKVMKYYKNDLCRMGVIACENESLFVSIKGMAMLQLGAIAEMRKVVDFLCKKAGISYEGARILAMN